MGWKTVLFYTCSLLLQHVLLLATQIQQCTPVTSTHVATSDRMDVFPGQEFHFTAVSSPMQRASNHYCKLRCDQIGSEQPSSSSSSSSFGVQWTRGRDGAAAQRGPCLFAFPLESNFSGERYAPAVVNQIQKQGLWVKDDEEQKEENAQRQEERTHGPGQPRSDMQTLSMANQQHDYEQQRDEAEVRQAVQGVTREEEHWQHQPAAEEAAKGLSGQQGCEEKARGLPSRPSHSEDARWHVLIDAAKACATAPPDLTKHPADFVVTSRSFHSSLPF